MDSATEFLFGQDVRSLGAGLPYPFYSPFARSSAADTHPANAFANSFLKAQVASSMRSRWNTSWPLQEFWKDRVKENMVTVTQFIKPILAKSVAKKKAAVATAADQGNAKMKFDGDREVQDGETLLDHLINYTDGMFVNLS